MDLKEKTAEVTELMKRTKSKWVATKPENTDVAIYLHFYRGEELVCAVQCPVDRDIALDACRLGAIGFSADVVSISFESYHTDLPESPVTGKRWMHREMQYVFETNPEAKEQGWVTECITTIMHERGGKHALRSATYRIVDGQVEWIDEVYHDSDDPDVQGAGVMFDALQNALAQPTIQQRINEAAKRDPVAELMMSLVSDDEARLFHTDMACYRAMEEKQLAVGVMFTAVEGSNRQQWLRERLGPPDDEA